jgi:hypothetical protein
LLLQPFGFKAFFALKAIGLQVPLPITSDGLQGEMITRTPERALAKAFFDGHSLSLSHRNRAILQ